MYGGFLNLLGRQSLPNMILSSSHVTRGFSLRFFTLAPASSLVHRDTPQLEAGIQLLVFGGKDMKGLYY